MDRRRPAVVKALLAWALVFTALGAVFASYFSPHLAVDLANLVWSCF